MLDIHSMLKHSTIHNFLKEMNYVMFFVSHSYVLRQNQITLTQT